MTLPWRVPGGRPEAHALLLTRPGGLAMHRSVANDTWRAALVRAGVAEAARPGERPEPGNGMHVRRHTAASAWLAAGVDVVSVAAWLGDNAATVLATYAHLMPDADDRGRKAMDAFFSRSAPGMPAAGER